MTDAARCNWPCLPEHEPPFEIPQPQTAPAPEQEKDQGAFPRIISTVGFGLFRSWNRQLLTPTEFSLLDDLYCHTYKDTRTRHIDAETLSDLAHTHLAQPLRSQAITALRAMQAAVFRNGVVWRLPLSSLDSWLASTDSRQPSDHDYERLQQLNDPEKPAVAILISLGYPTEALKTVRLNSDGKVSGPGQPTRPVPPSALMPLRVAADLNNGQLVTVGPRRIHEIVRELTQQFGFPMPQLHGRQDLRRRRLSAENLTLTYYRRKDEQ